MLDKLKTLKDAMNCVLEASRETHSVSQLSCHPWIIIA